MTEQTVLQLLQETFQTALVMAAPMLLISIVIGVVISVAQVVTSIHDPTLSFVPRMLAIVVAALVLLSWMMAKMTSFTVHLFSQFPTYVR